MKDYVAAQIVWDITEVIDMSFWDYEEFSRIDLAKRHECHYLFIFVNDAGISSSLDDFTEGTALVHTAFSTPSFL